MTKKELRAAMRRKNLGITPSERAAASGRIFGRIGRLEAFARARTVGVFCSAGRRTGHVGSAGAVVRRRQTAGCAARRGRRDAVLCIRSPDDAPGGFRHRRAGSGGAGVRTAGVGFGDRSRHGVHRRRARMGRGRGYYDKYLSQPEVHAVKIGVCFAHQLVGELPAEPHDVAMDYVVTD